jgi:hypothetical protein
MIDSTKHVVEFCEDMNALYDGPNGADWYSVNGIEADAIFKRWLGPAHPPKYVPTYYFEHCEFVSKYDVREYLLDD